MALELYKISREQFTEAVFLAQDLSDFETAKALNVLYDKVCQNLGNSVAQTQLEVTKVYPETVHVDV